MKAIKKADYVIIQRVPTECVDRTTECESLEAAVNEAEWIWAHLTERERKVRKAFYILRCADPSVHSPQHLTGEVVRDFKAGEVR